MAAAVDGPDVEYSYTDMYDTTVPVTTAVTDGVLPVDTGSASNGFLLWAAAMVFLMTPGLALFYSGLSKHNSALSLMMLCMMAYTVVCIQWVMFGFSLAFSEKGGLFIGDFRMGALNTLGTQSFPNTAPQIPAVTFCLYQMQFAGITAALVFGSVPERARFLPAMVFVLFWTTCVYDFIAYWTWADHGFLRNLACLGRSDYFDKVCEGGAYDFAGGGPVHITAGFSGLAYLLVLGKRKVIHSEHHNFVNVMFGTGVLWFGWFAFNGGSAGAASARAGMAALVSCIAAASGGLAWVWFDYISTRKLSAFSFCSGIVAGLVAITPGSGYVAPWAAFIIGVVTSLACNGFCRLKKRLGIDDSFDAGSLHGGGGFLGNILTGVFAQKWIGKLDGTAIDGGLVEGNWGQIFFQLVASAVIVSLTMRVVEIRPSLVLYSKIIFLQQAVWAFLVSLLILYCINKVPGLHLRQSAEDELRGGDAAEMGEAGYMLSSPADDARTAKLQKEMSRNNAIFPMEKVDSKIVDA